MILFPYAKINIGLEVLRKRPDCFHDLETVFYPLSFCDILEINRSDSFQFSITGIDLEGNSEENIVIKAYRLLQAEYNLPPVQIHLHKQIPVGAGLGGGSSDGAFTLMGLNDLFQLHLNEEKLIGYASRLGSDCAFFILNRPVFAEGTGNIFSEVEMNLRGYTLVLIKPNLSISTAEAYRGIVPALPEISLKERVKLPVGSWAGKVINRFEEGIFKGFPEIEAIKMKLYQEGAVYASMSGSGSSVYGLFESVPERLEEYFHEYFYWEEKC